MSAVEEAGGSSFGEYMTPLMTLSLKQGFGRLIRRGTDWGVVAILDERLSSKAYGRRARRDLPPAPITRDFRNVYRFFQEKMRVDSDFAVNVWLRPVSSGDGAARGWRCRVLRLLDGRADELVGEETGLESPALEIFAAMSGIKNLASRVEQASQSSGRYSIEVRCSRAAHEWIVSGGQPADLRRDWESVRSRWKSVRVLALESAILDIDT
jgi:ATP-dependent DNA helicase DinG